MLLENKVGIVTGGGMGMGEAVAKRWAAEGARVVLTDINSEAGQAVADSIQTGGGEARFVLADSGSEEDWENVISLTIQEFGGLDIMHNNAGIHFWYNIINDPIEKWDEMMRVNLRGVFLGCRFAIPKIIERGGGAIVNTSSISAKAGGPAQALYGASKAGVTQFTRSLARMYGPNGIRVNAINPGVIAAPMMRQAAAEAAESRADEADQMADPPPAGPTRGGPALGRLGTAEEIASVVTFLVSDEASYVSGVDLTVQRIIIT